MASAAKKFSRKMTDLTIKEDVGVIGYAVYWSLRETELSLRDLEKKLEEFNLATDFVKPEITARSSLSAALNAAIKKRMIRKIDSTHKEIIYAVVEEEIDKQHKDVSYNKESIITYDKEKKTVRFSAKKYPELEDYLRHYEAHVTSGQLRTAILQTINQYGAIGLRSMGGVYYCPPEKRELLNNLNRFTDSLNEESYLHFFGIVDSVVAKQALLVALKEEMRSDLDKQHRLVRLLNKGDRKMSSSTVELMEDSLDLMRTRIETVKRVTRFDDVDFSNDIAELAKLEKVFNNTVRKRGVADPVDEPVKEKI